MAFKTFNQLSHFYRITNRETKKPNHGKSKSRCCKLYRRQWYSISTVLRRKLFVSVLTQLLHTREFMRAKSNYTHVIFTQKITHGSFCPILFAIYFVYIFLRPDLRSVYIRSIFFYTISIIFSIQQRNKEI